MGNIKYSTIVLVEENIDELTSARKSIALVSSVARAGVTPLGVVASCIVMTPMSATSTFIHICNSEVITE